MAKRVRWRGRPETQRTQSEATMPSMRLASAARAGPSRMMRSPWALTWAMGFPVSKSVLAARARTQFSALALANLSSSAFFLAACAVGPEYRGAAIHYYYPTLSKLRHPIGSQRARPDIAAGETVDSSYSGFHSFGARFLLHFPVIIARSHDSYIILSLM